MIRVLRILAAASMILLGVGAALPIGQAAADDSVSDRARTPDASQPFNLPGGLSSPLLTPEFSVSRVLDDSQIAGQHLLVWQVSAPMSAERALARIASSWQAIPGARVLEHRHGSWRVLSRLSPGRLEVLQLRAGASQAEGFLSIWGPGQTSHPLSIARLIPHGFRSGLPLQTTEGARRVWSTSVEVDEPIASARQRLDRHLRAFDFVPVVLSDEAGEASIVRYAARGRALTVLARGAGSRTQFVLTLSESQP